MIASSARISSASDASPGSFRVGLISPGTRGVHLWLCCRDQVANSDDFKRRILARYTGMAPADLQFVLSEHGKPALLGSAQPLEFNLSHSGDWLACGVTAGTPVGVDLECFNPDRALMKVERRFFRPEEVTALQACGEPLRRDRFYDFWTLKEAAVKAAGEALVPGLKSRGFALAFGDSPQCGSGRIAVTTDDIANSALYGLLDPLPGYRLAICWQPETQLPPQLQVFELYAGDEVRKRSVPLRASSWLD